MSAIHVFFANVEFGDVLSLLNFGSMGQMFSSVPFIGLLTQLADRGTGAVSHTLITSLAYQHCVL